MLCPWCPRSFCVLRVPFPYPARGYSKVFLRGNDVGVCGNDVGGCRNDFGECANESNGTDGDLKWLLAGGWSRAPRRILPWTRHRALGNRMTASSAEDLYAVRNGSHGDFEGFLGALRAAGQVDD